ncbi:MAG: hypothetical protein J3R72DRAFT_185863 [Linnemannia gamsii]|nr:MAG: hypothetical protein J3R72DRAFT_185863 [Linnemannia gamsii]
MTGLFNIKLCPLFLFFYLPFPFSIFLLIFASRFERYPLSNFSSLSTLNRLRCLSLSLFFFSFLFVSTAKLDRSLNRRWSW